MNPFVSICMIVKNEEKVLERCLSSVTHLVDEVIIVDTGSTDSTVVIASNYTEKIFHFKWIDDFSAARNYAASKATGEWIIVLDADEYVDEENFNQFLLELKDTDQSVDAYTAKILNFTGRFGENLIQNFHDRVYRNNGEISYIRKIHEQFKRSNNSPLSIRESSLLIFHSGYLNQTVQEKDKRQRNKELLDLEFENNANKGFDYFNFGNEYFSIGEYSKALDAYLEAYKLKSDYRLSWVSTTLLQIIFCLMQLRKYNDALKVIQDSESIYSTSPEFPFLKSEIFYLRGQFDEAKEVLHHILNNNDKYNHIIFRPDLKEQVPHRRLGEIYYYKKDFRNAIIHYVGVLNLNKYCEESILRVMTILNMYHSPEEIEKFLISKNLLNNSNLKFYVRVCFEIGNPNLALLLINNFQEGNQLLNKIAKIKITTITGSGEIEDILSILDQKMIIELNQSSWLNIIDLFLLKNIEQLSDDLQFLEENKDFIQLVELLVGTEELEVSEELFLFSLKTLLQYKNYSLCNVLLKKVDLIPSVDVSKVAAVLFDYDFKAEALYLYDKGDISSYTKQDFVNIIESLLQTGNKQNAVQYSQYAVQIFNNDLRFYKYILDNANDENIYSLTLKKIREIFN